MIGMADENARATMRAREATVMAHAQPEHLKVWGRDITNGLGTVPRE